MNAAVQITDYNQGLSLLTRPESSEFYLSIYVSLEDKHKFNWLGQKIKVIKQKIKKLGKNISEEDLDQRIHLISDVLEKTNSAKGRSIALYQTNSSLHYQYLYHNAGDLVVVADSFHITPLLKQSSLDLSCLAIVITDKLATMYKVSHNSIFPIHSIKNLDQEPLNKENYNKEKSKSQKDLFFQVVLNEIQRTINTKVLNIAILGPKVRRKALKNELKKIGSKNIFYDGEIESSLEHIQSILLAKLENLLLEQNYLKKNSFLSDKGAVFSKSLEGIAKAVVQGRVSKLLIENLSNELWGELDRSTGILTTYSKQKNFKDDCVIDDICEEVIRYGGQVIFMDEKKSGDLPKFTAVMRW